jgi:regulator of cell morphogenesis and NO signaling
MQVTITEHTETVGQMAARDVRMVEIFKKHGIDFCCGGKKTVQQVCDEKGLDQEKIEAELRQLSGTSASAKPLPYNEWGLNFLVDYIINTHHAYVRRRLPEIMGYAIKVASVHGKEHPELFEIRYLVKELNADLMSHMAKEECVLFPYIKMLASGKVMDGQPVFSGIQNPIDVMQMEHEAAAGFIEEMKGLSNNFAIPTDACATYTVFYKMLSEFEDDLHIHVHLENNILFPKALLLEKNLR